MSRPPKPRTTDGTDGKALHPNLGVTLIVGTGRCGSTLLDRTAGQGAGGTSVGDLSALWRALETGLRCSCGLQARRRPFWTEVLIREFGQIDQVALGRKIQDLRRTLVFRRHLPSFATRVISRPSEAGFLGHRHVLKRLYQAIGNLTGRGRRYSMTPMDAFMAAGIEGVRLDVIHLIRDPAAWRTRGKDEDSARR